LKGIPMLRPYWLWPMRLGPLVKQRMPVTEWPGHLYLNLFRPSQDEIGGLRRTLILARAAELPEPTGLTDPIQIAGPAVITFEGEGEQFADLDGHETYLLTRLRAITRLKWLGVVDAPPEVPIGIHVRRSDFRQATQATDFITQGAIRTPLSWFVDALRLVRKGLGYKARAFVMTDGRPEELRDLFAEPEVEIVRPNSPLSDMLLLARSQVLIGSGGSSFSAWASFLGQMPTVSHPGQSLLWFKARLRKGQFVGELDPAAPPDQLMRQVASLGSAYSQKSGLATDAI
jgi:hypothetical protein